MRALAIARGPIVIAQRQSRAALIARHAASHRTLRHGAFSSHSSSSAQVTPRASASTAASGKALSTRAMASSSVAAASPAGPALTKVPGTKVNCWGQQDLDYKYPALNQDTCCDVCIVGAGVAGLTTAYRLAKAGKSVVVLEGRTRAAGTSGKSLGILSTWNTAYYQELTKLIGVSGAQKVTDAHSAALDFIYQTVKEENIDCGFEQVPGYLLADWGKGEWADKDAVRKIQKETEVCDQIGMVTGKLKQVAMPAGGGTEAIEFMHCATIHPIKYLEGLAEACVRRGVRIHENTRTKGGVITGPSKGRVQTMSGHTVTAKEGVVLATHSPINRDQAWVHNRQLPWRSYVIGMELPKDHKLTHAIYWDTAEQPHQVRVVKDGAGEGQDLLLVQGAHHHQGIGQDKIGDPYGSLEAWARKHFVPSGRVVYQWSAQDYFPADLLGLYGINPIDWERPPNYILTGHAGQEWTCATLGSEIVSDHILGRSNRYADVYKPSRVIAASIPRYATELGQYFTTVGVSILKHVVPRSLEDLKGLAWPPAVEKDLKPGEGKVLQHGWRKKAIYKDHDGTVHIKSALCTHLGCCVEWNQLDGTFDCPCHGSQYDACGRCVAAPAVGDLEDLGTKRV